MKYEWQNHLGRNKLASEWIWLQPSITTEYNPQRILCRLCEEHGNHWFHDWGLIHSNYYLVSMLHSYTKSLVVKSYLGAHRLFQPRNPYFHKNVGQGHLLGDKQRLGDHYSYFASLWLNRLSICTPRFDFIKYFLKKALIIH